MPTLSNDVQAVLATDKVRFQGQEVAFVVAEDRYSARDALELIEVDYDMLPPVIDVRKALDRRRPGHPRRPRGQGRQPLLRLGDRRRRGHRRGVRQSADVVVARRTSSTPASTRRRWRPAAAWPTSSGSTGKLTLWTTSQAPHAHRTVYALVSGLPEHKIRIIAPDIGGGFGNKVPIYPGYVCAIVASLVIGKPVKWMEDRTENLRQHRLRPRLRHAGRDRRHQRRQDPRHPHQRAGRPRRLQRHRRARSSTRPGSSACSPAATTSRRPTAR